MAVFPSLGLAQSSSGTNKSTPSKEEVIGLEAFVVQSEGTEGYDARLTTAGTRTVKPLGDIPSSISIINRQLIDDLGATYMDQALKFGTAGVTQNQTISDDTNIRGFRAIDSLRDGVRNSNFKRNQMYDVDRLEVIKGPSGMIIGSNDFIGGAVNFITKQPSSKKTGQAKLTVGSDKYVRGEANVTGPLMKADNFSSSYRLTAGAETGDPEKKIESIDQKFAGGALGFTLGGNINLVATAYYFVDNGYKYWQDFTDINLSIPGRQPVLHKLSTRSFSPAPESQAFWDMTEKHVDVTFTAKLSDNGNLRLYYAYARLRDRERILRAVVTRPDNVSLFRQDIPYLFDNTRNTLQAEYLYRTIRAHWRNDLQVGMDVFQRFDRQGTIVLPVPDLDASTLNYGNYDQPAFSYNTSSFSSDRVRTDRAGTYYVQDNITLLDDRLILVGGLRWIDTFQQTQNLKTNVITQVNRPPVRTHRYGVVLKPFKDMSLYAVDTNTVTVNSGFDGYGVAYRNSEGVLKEYGLKLARDVGNIHLFGTLAYFDLKRTNVPGVFFIDPVLGPINIQAPAATSKGWELEVGGRLKTSIGNADVIVTYYDGKTVNAGTKLPFDDAADIVYSLFGKFTWNTTPLKGFTLGGGFYDQSAKTNGPFRVDTPMTYNVMARYAIGERWALQFNGDNVADKRFIVAWGASGLVQTNEGSNYRISASYRW